MSGTLTICQTSDDVLEKLKKFRFQKVDGTCAIILKIDRKEGKIVIDEELNVCSVEDVVATLPEREPRFVVFSYKVRHSDNRISYPLCLIFFSPQGCSPDIQMMYAGSRNNLAKEAGIGKVCKFEWGLFDSFSIIRARRVHSLSCHYNQYMHLLLNGPNRPYADEPPPDEEKLLRPQHNVDYQSYWTKYFPMGVPQLVNFPNDTRVQGPFFTPEPQRSFDPRSKTVCVLDRNSYPNPDRNFVPQKNLTVEDVTLKSVVFRERQNIPQHQGGGKMRRNLDSSFARNQQHGNYASNVQKLVDKSKSTILRRNNCYNMLDSPLNLARWPSENLSPTPGNIYRSSTATKVAHRILRRQKLEPYHRLLSGCPIDRTHEIYTFQAIGTEDLLCNLTCKSTKLARQRGLFPVQDIRDQVMTDRPRFYYRPRRGFDPDYFGPDFGLEPLFKVPISPKDATDRISMSRYLRRADWYDRSLNRLQREWSHQIRNQLHMLNLISLAGESNGFGSAGFERHSEYLLKCYEHRVRKFMNSVNY